jgi:xanthine dehydrogenase accessory factor
MRILRWAISTPARYVGMIGSKRKLIEVAKQLQQEGIPIEKLQGVHSPMGLDIGAVTPEEIAVAVVAELVHWRRCPAAGWNPISKSLFAGGIPDSIKVEQERSEIEEELKQELEASAPTQ